MEKPIQAHVKALCEGVRVHIIPSLYCVSSCNVTHRRGCLFFQATCFLYMFSTGYMKIQPLPTSPTFCLSSHAGMKQKIIERKNFISN